MRAGRALGMRFYEAKLFFFLCLYSFLLVEVDLPFGLGFSYVHEKSASNYLAAAEAKHCTKPLGYIDE